MADFTVLSNAAVGIGGLPSGATVTALRDNPIAIAEGSPGATPVRGEAMAVAEDWGIGGYYPAVNVLASDDFSITEGLLITVFASSATSSTYAVMRTIENISYSGVIRFKASISSPAGSITVTARLLLNGVEQEVWSTTTSLGISRDVSIVRGDVVTWELKTTAADAGSNLVAPTQTGTNALIPAALPLKTAV